MTVTPIITSLLDTDLYKITMQAAIHKNYPNTQSEFLLTNRTPTKRLNKKAYEWLCEQISSLGDLRFTEEELEYLKLKLGYLGDEYFQWLSKLRLNPDLEVKIVPEIINNGEYNLSITATGDWEVVTLYEIPILSLLSECYFRFIDRKWTINGKLVAEFNNDGEELPGSNYQLVLDQASCKSQRLLENGCVFSEFGTRRRRSFKVQDHVIKGMASQLGKIPTGKILGTSNVLLAKNYNLEPIGTIGHEWMMGIGAISAASTKHGNGDGAVNYDAYLTANRLSIEKYVNYVGPQHAGLALTDTYGTLNYLNQFDEPYLSYYIGVRQDSGDPKKYAKMLSKWYKEHGYLNKSDKLICFSDSLNVEKCIDLKKYCDLPDVDINCSFGIGTNLTNDFDSEPMNIVMKLLKCGGGNAVKISDNVGKNMGDLTTVSEVKKRLGFVENDDVKIDESHRWMK